MKSMQIARTLPGGMDAGADMKWTLPDLAVCEVAKSRVTLRVAVGLWRVPAENAVRDGAASESRLGCRTAIAAPR